MYAASAAVNFRPPAQQPYQPQPPVPMQPSYGNTQQQTYPTQPGGYPTGGGSSHPASQPTVCFLFILYDFHKSYVSISPCSIFMFFASLIFYYEFAVYIL